MSRRRCIKCGFVGFRCTCQLRLIGLAILALTICAGAALGQTTAPLSGYTNVAGWVGARIGDGTRTAHVTTVGGNGALDVNCVAGCSGSGGGGAASLSTNYQWSGSAWVRVVGDETNGTKVQATSLPLPTGASTETTLAAIKAKTDNLDVALSTRTKPADAQHAIIDSGTTTATQATGTNLHTVVDSGAVTANAGTNLNTSALALDSTVAKDGTLTGGTQKAIARGGAKGATTAADLTGTAEGVDHQALDVQIMSGGAAKDPTQVRALTSADVVTGEVSKWIGSSAPTVGQKAMASSLPVAIASDQSSIAVTASGTVAVSSITTSVTPGTAAANLGKAEDSVAADGDTAIAMLAVRKDVPTNLVSGAGDYAAPELTATGALWVDQEGRAVAPVSGQVAVTASATAIASNAVNSVCIKAFIGNAITVYVGPSGVTTSTGYGLEPGDFVCYAADNSSRLFLIASTTGASVYFTGN